jgi:hypothetical protein
MSWWAHAVLRVDALVPSWAVQDPATGEDLSVRGDVHCLAYQVRELARAGLCVVDEGGVLVDTLLATHACGECFACHAARHPGFAAVGPRICAALAVQLRLCSIGRFVRPGATSFVGSVGDVVLSLWRSAYVSSRSVYRAQHVWDMVDAQDGPASPQLVRRRLDSASEHVRRGAGPWLGAAAAAARGALRYALVDSAAVAETLEAYWRGLTVAMCGGVVPGVLDVAFSTWRSN